jgi:hypothetical protein
MVQALIAKSGTYVWLPQACGPTRSRNFNNLSIETSPGKVIKKTVRYVRMPKGRGMSRS